MIVINLNSIKVFENNPIFTQPFLFLFFLYFRVILFIYFLSFRHVGKNKHTKIKKHSQYYITGQLYGYWGALHYKKIACLSFANDFCCFSNSKSVTLKRYKYNCASESLTPDTTDVRLCGLQLVTIVFPLQKIVLMHEPNIPKSK